MRILKIESLQSKSQGWLDRDEIMLHACFQKEQIEYDKTKTIINNFISKTNQMRYIFAKNINNTGEAGIVDLATEKTLCLCGEANSELLLEALRLYTLSGQSKSLICPRCKSINSQNITASTKECLDCGKLWAN